MKRKRNPSAHERQMRFFTVLFGALLVLLMIALLWMINRVPLHAG